MILLQKLNDLICRYNKRYDGSFKMLKEEYLDAGVNYGNKTLLTVYDSHFDYDFGFTKKSIQKNYTSTVGAFCQKVTMSLDLNILKNLFLWV